jgi:hypothetical protein
MEERKRQKLSQRDAVDGFIYLLGSMWVGFVQRHLGTCLGAVRTSAVIGWFLPYDEIWGTIRST